MRSRKYDRSISLLCPTCGSSDFSYDEGVDVTGQIVTCTSCGREISYEELQQENRENIEEHLSALKDEVTKDFANQFRRSLKKTFSRR
jgi:predicted RNA-binding Zn-ribbon protein involved in translation (DUF1610 family)